MAAAGRLGQQAVHGAVLPAELDERYRELEQRWPEGTPVPMPDFWGGYQVHPDMMEFWQGQPSRMHDRIRYRRSGQAWEVARLSP